MNTLPIKSKIGIALSVLAMAISLQGCNKESAEQAAPALSTTLEANAITPSAAINIAPCKTVCLVAGQYMLAGTVEAAIQQPSGDLIVTYRITQSGTTINEVHLEVFNEVHDLSLAKKLSGGGAIPGKFTYKASFPTGSTSVVQVVVPANKLPVVPGDPCFYIGAHAALSSGETAWGQLCNQVATPGRRGADRSTFFDFPGSNWGAYFSFCTDDCRNTSLPVSYTYAWEDKQNMDNDADYNDLVIQSTIFPKSNSITHVAFLASARGAGFEHAFKFTVPKSQVSGAYVTAVSSSTTGQPAVGNLILDDDGTGPLAGNWIVTVFPSTKAVLPPSSLLGAGGSTIYPFSANTAQDQTLKVPAYRIDLDLTMKVGQILDANVPLQPFIHVFNSESNTEYDLFIEEISGSSTSSTSSTWTNSAPTATLAAGVYPNGIIINKDWSWPLERRTVSIPYPNFLAAANIISGHILNHTWFLPGSTTVANTYDKGPNPSAL